MEETERLTSTQVSENAGWDDWRVLLRTLQASFSTGSMARGVEFAARIGAAADQANHHPDLTITYPRVHVLLTTHDADSLTTRDVDLAQQMDAPRPQRNRIHIDVTVPHDVAQQRIAAALAAGGALVSDAAAPAWWVLADPEGNEACISTWQGRD